MVFDNLNVRISASTQDFSRGINSAERHLSSLVDDALQASGAMQILQGRTDEAGDEISQAGRKAATTGSLFSALSISTEGLSLSFGSLSTVLVVSLIPALVLLSTTLVPITATIGAVAAAAGALAGAFGAVIGTGVVAYHQQLKNQGSSLVEVLKEVKNELMPIIAAFGSEFVPLIKDAIQAIPDLVRNTLAAVGGLDAFVNALRNAGQAAFRIIPQMVSAMMDLARRALPMLVDFARWLIQNGPSIFRGMMQTAREVGPTLLGITQSAIELLPVINEIGIFIIQKLVPAFNKAVQIFSQFSPEVSAIATEIRKMLPFLTQLGSDIARVAVPAIKQFLSVAAGILHWFNELNAGEKKALITGLATAIGILGGPIAAIGAAVVIAANHWEFFEGVINSVASAVEWLHDKLVGLWNFLTQNPVSSTLGDIAGFMMGGPRGMSQNVTTGVMNTPGDVRLNQNQNIQVEVKGDTGVIEEVSARTIDNQNRRVNRNRGRNPTF